MVITKTEHKVLRFANEERNFSCIYSCTGANNGCMTKKRTLTSNKNREIIQKGNITNRRTLTQKL